MHALIFHGSRVWENVLCSRYCLSKVFCCVRLNFCQIVCGLFAGLEKHDLAEIILFVQLLLKSSELFRLLRVTRRVENLWEDGHVLVPACNSFGFLEHFSLALLCLEKELNSVVWVLGCVVQRLDYLGPWVSVLGIVVYRLNIFLVHYYQYK